MALTPIDRIVDLVLASLAGIVPSTGVIGEDIDLAQIEPQTTHAISVSYLGSTPADAEIADGYPLDFSTQIRVTTWARADKRGTTSARPSRLLAMQCLQRVWADAGLRNAGIYLTLPVFDAAQDITADTRQGAVSATYEITHRATLAELAQ